MIYINQNTPIRTIYQNGKFILFVIKGTPYSQIYFPGGGGAKGAITGFSQTVMATYNGNIYTSGANHIVPNTTVISDQYMTASTGWQVLNSQGLPWVFYKSDGGYSTSQILVNFRLYSPSPASITYGPLITQTSDFTGASEYTPKTVNIVAGYNYIADTLTVTTKDTRKYIAPLVFGSWITNWTMDHMSVQII